MDDSQRFVTQMFQNKERPHDAFAQAHSLLESDYGDVTSYDQICEKQMFLANISCDKSLHYAQTDLRLLTHLYYMAQRDPELVPFWRVLYYSTKAELQLTRAKNGLEIKAQHNVASQFAQSARNMMGYADPGSIQTDPRQKEPGLLQKLFNRIGKKPPAQEPEQRW